MDYQIRWSPRAVNNLEGICSYIAKDSEYLCCDFAKRVMAITESLIQFSKSGWVDPEYDDFNLREKIYGNYRIVYRLKEEYIEMIAICHSAKNNLSF